MPVEPRRVPKPIICVFGPWEQVRPQWRTLVENNPAVGLYHSERWIEALHLTYRFAFQGLMAHSQGRPTAGLLFARVRRPLNQWMVALPFSDTCPPLASEPEIQAELINTAQRQFADERLEIRGISAPPGWQTLDCFLSWRADLSAPSATLYRSLATNFRRNLVKAAKAGIQVEHGTSLNLLERFYRLQSAERQHLGLPAQPKRFFRNLHRLFAGNIDIWLATSHGRDCASLFMIGHDQTLYYKWSARIQGEMVGAGHLLVWSMIEHHAGHYRFLDLGRTDARNSGLNRFKRELGGHSTPLPYACFPSAQRNQSSEVLSAKQRLLAGIWRRLPNPICRLVERSAYRYLS